ncbi:hypothetical protein BC828DRAFT_381297 [Blastocladiella britannica]|nr:hypothetical protein BC828DRAFT_381297 [Blastocladiella britannica]
MTGKTGTGGGGSKGGSSTGGAGSSGRSGGGGGGHAMTPSAASHIQSTQAKSGGDMSSSGFASRAQSAGDRNANSGRA